MLSLMLLKVAAFVILVLTDSMRPAFCHICTLSRLLGLTHLLVFLLQLLMLLLHKVSLSVLI